MEPLFSVSTTMDTMFIFDVWLNNRHLVATSKRQHLMFLHTVTKGSNSKCLFCLSMRASPVEDKHSSIASSHPVMHFPDPSSSETRVSCSTPVKKSFLHRDCHATEFSLILQSTCIKPLLSVSMTMDTMSTFQIKIMIWLQDRHVFATPDRQSQIPAPW